MNKEVEHVIEYYVAYDIKVIENDREIFEVVKIDKHNHTIQKYVTLDTKEFRKLFNKLCKHLPSYEGGKYSSKFEWSKCRDCILHDIPHGHRDLCFFIWHESMLEGSC